ncbi:hypothetical protein HPP92_020559 [Vanilla planifolia]|uniref:PHD-type domain-containing protein n=1 Tax=Vanilla planifolia TaxID=51239 RepID=A0A835PX84_VANPL|nr:hypothetical protein HPP92_020960 [Vanilla planifolia]KAG0462083.1 hypothetical protein HPP92_020559 [Vanilla planifolia]
MVLLDGISNGFGHLVEKDTTLVEKKFIFPRDMRVESGTCNVCSAPCSSCMHYGLSLSAVDSISESGFSSSLCTRKKSKSSFFNVDSMPISKVRICDDLHNAETSNFLSTGSSHESYSEIAESKTNLRVSIANEVLSSRKIFEQRSCMRKSDQDCTTLCVHLSSDMCQRFHPGLGEEHCESECHGDSILLPCGGTDAKITTRDGMVDIKEEDIACSNVAISSSMKVNSPAVPGRGFQECETGENHWNSSGSNASINASSLDSSSYSASGCSGASVKPQNPLCRNDVSSKICSLHSMSQAETSPCLNYGSKDIQGIVNLQPKEEITAFSEVDTVESSLASLPCRSFSEHRSNSFTNHEDQKSMLFSSRNSNIDDLCKESINDTDLHKQLDNNLKGSNAHEPFKKDDAVLSAPKSQDDRLQPVLVSEVGPSESDVVLYDVKVCDICGDAGREDLLATCSRCNDGAEHTYCMWEKMDKVPEGDWLCEECKIKTENWNADQSDAASVRLKPMCPNEINHDSVSTFIPRKRQKLVERTAGLDVQGRSNGLQRPNTLTRRQVNHLQETKSLDVCRSAEITSPMKKPILSSQASLKIRDSGKLKTAVPAPLPEVSEAISLKNFL